MLTIIRLRLLPGFHQAQQALQPYLQLHQQGVPSLEWTVYETATKPYPDAYAFRNFHGVVLRCVQNFLGFPR